MKKVISLFILLFFSTAQAEVFPHDFGQITLKKTPVKIAALNWTQTEFLLSLGIAPVAITTIKGYHTWQSNNPPLTNNPIELGHRAEPNLEALLKAKPDLILGYNWRHSRLYPRLEKIAPTALFKQYPSLQDPRDYLKRMRTNFIAVANILDKKTEAQAQLQQLDQVLQQSREKIHRAGLSGQKVLIGKFVGMGLGIRVFGKGSLAGAIIEQLGMKNAWSRTLPGRDFSHIDLLQLPLIGKAHLILIGSGGEARSMTQSAVWQQLPAVQAKQVYRLPQLWSYGGPQSAIRMTKTLTNILLEPASQAELMPKLPVAQVK